MKTLYLLILFFVMAATASAQFTLLDKWHGPKDTDVEGYRTYDSVTTVVPKSTGANQTWNFGPFNMVSGASMTTYKLPSAVPSASAFPTANLVGDEGNNTFSYYFRDTSKLELVGGTSTQGTDTYTDPMQIMKWGMTYGSSYNDVFAGTEGTMAISGTITTNATGHGNVTLPGGSMYMNCMQLRSLVTITSGTLMGKVTNYRYYWDLTKFPLIEISYNLLTDGTDTIFYSGDIQVNYLLAHSINDYNFDAEMTLYPNPAKSHFDVIFANKDLQDCALEIYDITGKLERKVDLGNQVDVRSTVDVTGLASGIYLVKSRLGDRHATHKLVIE
jgi:hypothetical protein